MCCLPCVVRCLLFVDCCCGLCNVCRLLIAKYFALFVVRSVLRAVVCLRFDVRCALLIVCWYLLSKV